MASVIMEHLQYLHDTDGGATAFCQLTIDVAVGQEKRQCGDTVQAITDRHKLDMTQAPPPDWWARAQWGLAGAAAGVVLGAVVYGLAL
jgi:hypothetical protein